MYYFQAIMGMNFEEIVNKRRAMRQYQTAIQPDTEIIKKCIQLATLSPSSSNLQLWECYHVIEAEMVKQLREVCLSQSAALTAPQFVVFVSRKKLFKQRAKQVLAHERRNILKNSPEERQPQRLNEIEFYYNKMVPFLYSRVLGILGIIRLCVTGLIGIVRPTVREVTENDIRIVLHKSCALAAQTFMLAMTNEGYDTCPLEGFDSRRLKSLLKLPPDAEVTMVITCGLGNHELGVRGERFRVPFKEIYHQI